MENKKTLVLTIVGVLVLVIAVVGVSFAMYTFTGTGSRDNVIRTGTVSIDYAPGVDAEGNQGSNTKLTLTNQYPISDASGSQLSEGAAQLDFAVAAEMSGAMTIDYELALTDVTVDGETAVETENTTYKLGTDDVRFNIKKGANYILDTDEKVGISVASRADKTGTMTDTDGAKVVNSYFLDNGTFTQTGSVSYSIRAWVADTYDLDHTTEHADNVHTNNTTTQTFSFKVKVVAAQK